MKPDTRKFLVVPGAWRPGPSRGVFLRQGYLSSDAARTVSVQVAEDVAYLTVKGIVNGVSRLEFEFPIEVDAAETLLAHLCLRPLIEKRRYCENYGGWSWQIDLFEGENAGLVLAEVSLPTALSMVVLPSWVGREVTRDPRYFSTSLARHPCSDWGNLAAG